MPGAKNSGLTPRAGGGSGERDTHSNEEEKARMKTMLAGALNRVIAGTRISNGGLKRKAETQPEFNTDWLNEAEMDQQ